ETKEAVVDRLMQYAETAYQAKEAELTEPMMRQVEQFVVLKTIDSKWISYLTMMEQFKEGIGLRAFGQKDPLVEYKNEAFAAFQELLNDIQFDIASNMYRVQLRTEPPVPTPPPVMATNRPRPSAVRAEDVAQPPKPPKAGSAAPATPGRLPFRRPQPLNFAGVGRNDICPCGSGKRFKNCHGH